MKLAYNFSSRFGDTCNPLLWLWEVANRIENFGHGLGTGRGPLTLLSGLGTQDVCRYRTNQLSEWSAVYFGRICGSHVPRGLSKHL